MHKRIVFFLLAVALALPFLAEAAATPFYYGGWIPFWSKQAGASDIALHLDQLHEVSPFSYEVSSRGILLDKLNIDQGLWPGWLSAAHDAKVKIIPTIAWFDGDAIQALLSNTKHRQAHEDAIAKLVRTKRFDGIDIDYEGKLAATKPYFSLLVKGLAMRLHPKGKILSCTIEARTPLTSLENSDAPERKPSYGNDYPTLNKYCDEVRVMAYDQGTIDVTLDAVKGNGSLYAPVADPDWVEKVIKETIKTISKKKIVLAIPTYGYEYEVGWNSGIMTYRRLRSVGFFTAMDLADRVGATTYRNSAGELSFTYTTSTFFEVPTALRSAVSSTIPAGLLPSALTSTSSVTRFVSLSDAPAIRQKIQLAKKYGLRGAVFFKLDGAADPLLWEEMR